MTHASPTTGAGTMVRVHPSAAKAGAEGDVPRLVRHRFLAISTLRGMIANETQKVVSHFDRFGWLMKPK